MSEFVVPTDFLIGGWFGVKKLGLPSKFSVLGQQIKIVAFQKGGAGMRVSHYNLKIFLFFCLILVETLDFHYSLGHECLFVFYF